jgi:2-dehydro-3-deoxyphosphogluconate aldolase/(4S)-4-hydroxy-2-oxoglutarate aldolase
MNEIVDAFDSGAWIVKVFPADSVGGGGFFKSVRAPMSWFRGMPTGGVKLSKDSMMTWMKNGTSCLGIGGDMVSKEILDSADWIALSQRMRDANQWIGEIRAELAEKEDK